MSTAETYLTDALNAFDLGTEIESVARFGYGHINDTFLIRTCGDPQPGFILQRISNSAFKDPSALMSNVIGVSEYLGQRVEALGGDRRREAMHFLRTRSGAAYYTDGEGRAWRVYRYIDKVLCCERADTPELFAASGYAFGRFQQMLGDFDAGTLFETIPRFHDTEARLSQLKEAVAVDRMGRVKDCSAEIAFVMAREADCSVAMQALRDGILPLRVTHNDTKLNNVLIDEVTGKGVCVIDLDTVMPGLAINDFGDSIRFGANHCAEDETDLSKMSLDLTLYEVYARAFLEGAGNSLTAAERQYMPWGAKLMTLECGMRFLTDHLSGDTYFQIQRPGQNLDRCRTQFKLVEDMEQHWEEMNTIIQKL